MNTIKQALAWGLLSTTALAACNLDVPDLNNPGLAQLQDTPTAALVTSACTGLFIGNRSNMAAENGYVLQLGVLGREAYNFDAADPRFISELILGKLNKSSPFGGNFWPFPYTNIREANIILAGVGKVAEFSDTDKTLINGFTHTIQALDLLEVINAHDTNGAVIDTDHPLGDPLGAIVSKDQTFAKIIALLDMGATELGGATKDDVFPFQFSSGFHNDDLTLTLDTPVRFLAFNRAVKARVAVYTKDYASALDALGASFLVDTGAAIPMSLGAYYPYSTKSNDTTNSLINANIYAHPSFETDAQKNGTTVDLRYTAKIAPADKPGANAGLQSSIQFSKLYSSPSSPVALIRNEELILLKAEALFYSGMTTEATTELNLVRQQSGGLTALAPTTDEATFVNELLYERRYSLMFEGGHRWIDLRRFGKPLPIDRTDTNDGNGDTANVRYPIPQAECDARPGEQACTLDSV